MSQLISALVDGTTWSVGGFDSDGTHRPHPVPWVFNADGTMHAGDLWTGVWESRSESTLFATITMKGGGTDSFDVQIIGGIALYASKNGQAYRLGTPIYPS